jgi:hypothetical protein
MPCKKEEDDSQPTNEARAEPNSFELCLARRKKTIVNENRGIKYSLKRKKLLRIFENRGKKQVY